MERTCLAWGRVTAHNCAGRVSLHSCFPQRLWTAPTESTGEGGTPALCCFQQRDRATNRNQESRFPFAAGESEPAGSRIVSENIPVGKRYGCSFAEIKSLRLFPKDTKLLDLQFGAKTFPVKSWKDLLEHIWAKAKKS